ncbi:hypothetical protein GCM10010174_69940 [Kutzneria viridogrisea]|uniref:RNase P subunit RPR2 n=1 Tax=Kutzneria viridogrisea TaxID=47990 RepID=A0ABR6BAV7_9PSEU|nr:RNase P subunit RPR2 [Kutzneria viridogrisea]
MTRYALCVVDARPVLVAGRICGACWSDLEHDLVELVDSLAADLDITLAGLGRSGGSPIGIVVRSASRGLGFDERAADLARDLRQCLGGWVRVLCEDNALPLRVRDTIPALAAWLLQHETEVRAHPAVDDLWQEVREHIEQVRHVIDRRPDRRYVGICSEWIEAANARVRCGADLYVDEDRPTVTCRECGAVHHVGHRREVLLGALDDQLGTATEVARAFAAYAGVELTLARIGMWARRGQIVQHRPRKGERSFRYRVGDVRRLLDQSSDIARKPLHTNASTGE